jgi:hypothetical protein
MTQGLRIKWILGLVGANAALAAGVLGLGVHQYRSVRVEAASARGEAAAARQELRASEVEASGLRASLAERRVCPSPQASPVETQLSQTLQVIASEQQMLLFQALHPADLSKPADPRKSARPQARRSPRRRNRLPATCGKS